MPKSKEKMAMLVFLMLLLVFTGCSRQGNEALLPEAVP
jgi:hypothetical protein